MSKIRKNDNRVSLSLLTDVISGRKIDRERLTVSADLCCPSGFPAFEGHFPGQPVLPAVIQLTVVRLLSSEILNRHLLLEKIKKVKFKQMVRPHQTVHVEVTLKELDGRWHADFCLSREGSNIASGSLILFEG